MREDFVGAVGLNKIARFRLDPRDARTDADYYERDRRRRRRVRLHVAARLPRRLPEGPAAADADRLHAPQDAQGRAVGLCSRSRVAGEGWGEGLQPRFVAATKPPVV
ncbi:MAG: hypothetical protein MZV64_44800 [Ignavibacteriales bacterium]|nr:hypothetical protein [Ignavibacteriales bacterium]